MNYLPQTQVANALLNIHDADIALGEMLSIYKIDYNGHRGMISVSTGGYKDKVSFVWLALSRSRILWPDYDPKDKEPNPLCKSLDGDMPSAGITMRPGPCYECQDSQWIDGKPLCAEIFNLLCFDTEDQAPFVFGVKRTGIKYLRILKGQLKHRASELLYPGIPVNCAAKLELKAKPEAKHFIPDFTVLARNSQEEAQFYYGLAKKFLRQLSPIDPEELNGHH